MIPDIHMVRSASTRIRAQHQHGINEPASYLPEAHIAKSIWELLNMNP